LGTTVIGRAHFGARAGSDIVPISVFLLHGLHGLFTDTSEHIHDFFTFIVFPSFSIFFRFWFRAVD